MAIEATGVAPGDAVLVSYVIPCFNHGDFVGDAIQSVIDQEYGPIELIVIDDGSTDHSLQVIRQLEERCRGRFERFEVVTRENRGVVPSLNQGLDWARGTYFALLASDDILYPNKTSRMVEILSAEAMDVVAAYGGMTIIDKNGRDLKTLVGKPGLYGFESIILKKCPWATPTQIIRTEALRKIGGFDPTLEFEDWAMLLALTSAGDRIVIVSDVVTKYRRHDANISKKIDANHAYRLKVLRKYRDHPLYERALARVLAGHATEVAKQARRLAVASLKEAYNTYRPIVFDEKFRRGWSSVLNSSLGF